MSKDLVQDVVPAVEMDGMESYGGMLRPPTDSQDNEYLSRTGKKSVLKVSDACRPSTSSLSVIDGEQRTFGFMSILGFCSLVMSTWLGAFV